MGIVGKGSKIFWRFEYAHLSLTSAGDIALKTLPTAEFRFFSEIEWCLVALSLCFLKDLAAMWFRGQCVEILGSFRAKQFCQKRNKIVVEGGQTIISGTVYIEVKKRKVWIPSILKINSFKCQSVFRFRCPRHLIVKHLCLSLLVTEPKCASIKLNLVISCFLLRLYNIKQP